MAIRQPTRKKMYRTMQGRLIDIDKLRAQNETVPAIGNMGVNARGDVLGSGGRIVKAKEEVMKEYYQTPKGVAQDTPVKREPRVQPIAQPRVEQVKTMNPSAQTVAPRNRTVKTVKKEEPKSGIDAALDGIE